MHSRIWGIKAIYMTPINRSGGVKECNYTPSTDGNFDPISFDIDKSLGEPDEYSKMVNAMGKDILLIRNLVPLHTGMGPDFLLALLGHEKYENLYMMAEIPEGDWGLLPDIPTSASDWPVPSHRWGRTRRRS